MSESAQRHATGAAPSRRSLWWRVKGPAIFALVSLALIWIAAPSLPARWGIHFGVPYRIFFTLALLGAALFFVLLNWGPTRQPGTPALTFVSILAIYVGTVGGVMAFGLWYYPQFEVPRDAGAKGTEQAAEKRGRNVFLGAAGNCFACHTIETLGIRGGQRGPDLSDSGKQAGVRRPGTSADEYLLQSIVDPWACFTPLPGSGLVECQSKADPAKTYPQLMPPGSRERLSETELSDLVAFLKSLTGAPEKNGASRKQ